MPFNVSTRSHGIAEQHHYTPAHFNQNIAPRIIGAQGITWANASNLQSCAMRMSIALAYAGVNWQPPTSNSWRLQGSNVYFPSLASDYPDLPLLTNRLTVNSQQAINGRRGVVYFGGDFDRASGHLTLWNGASCHFDAVATIPDSYWGQPNIYFWQMTV